MKFFVFPELPVALKELLSHVRYDIGGQHFLVVKKSRKSAALIIAAIAAIAASSVILLTEPNRTVIGYIKIYHFE